MSFQTKAFAAQDQLLAALNNSSGLTAWSKDYGLPSRRDEQHIWIDENISEWNQQLGSTGIVSRNEDFRIHLYIYARHSGYDATDLRDEISAAASAVSEAIGSTPFLGGSVLFAEIVGAEYEGAFADPEGRTREGVLHLIIACSTFLS